MLYDIYNAYRLPYISEQEYLDALELKLGGKPELDENEFGKIKASLMTAFSKSLVVDTTHRDTKTFDLKFENNKLYLSIIVFDQDDKFHLVELLQNGFNDVLKDEIGGEEQIKNLEVEIPDNIPTDYWKPLNDSNINLNIIDNPL